jgi:hypothetical protein
MNETQERASGKNENKGLREWLAVLTGLLFVFTAAAMYGIGRAYRAGYLYQIGLDLDQVPEDFYGYLYWCYTGGAPLSLIWFAAAALIFFVLAGASSGVTYLARRWTWLRRLVDWWDDFPNIRDPKTHHRYAGLGILIICFAYLIFVTCLLLSQAHDSGARRAHRVIDQLAAAYDSAADTKTQWIEIRFNNDPARLEYGYRLLCTVALCSVYDPPPNGRGVRVVSLQDVQQIAVLSTRPSTSELSSAEPRSREQADESKDTQPSS